MGVNTCERMWEWRNENIGMKEWENRVCYMYLGAIQNQFCHEFEDGCGHKGVVVPKRESLLQQSQIGRVTDRSQGLPAHGLLLHACTCTYTQLLLHLHVHVCM